MPTEGDTGEGTWTPPEPPPETDPVDPHAPPESPPVNILTDTGYEEHIPASEEVSFDAQTATREIYVFDDTLRAVFEERILGYVYLGEDGTFERAFPVVHPYRVWLRASKISWEAMNEDYRDGGTTHYDAILFQAPMANGAKATITYERPPWHIIGYDKGEDPAERDLIHFKAKSVSRSLSLPTDYYVWQTAAEEGAPPRPISQDGTQARKVIQTTAITIERLMAPKAAWTAIRQLKDRVNATTFTFFEGSPQPIVFEKECLRFIDADIEPATGPNGWRGYNIIYQFEATDVFDLCADDPSAKKFVGWNRLFDPSRSKWDYIALYNNSFKLIYDYDDDPDITQTIAGEDVTGFELLFNPLAN